MRPSSLLPALLLCASLPLAAWGRKGHQIVATLAVQDLPAELAPWFQGREERVRLHSSDPDHWKDDRREGPRHFMEVETYGGMVPIDLAKAQAQAGPEGFIRAGQAPWVIQDRVRDLAAAFKSGDPERVAFLASILSHYVADLHVPLHTTRNYDGQLTGQAGVHSRWETSLVEHLTGTPEVRPATLEKDLFEAPWRWLQEANGLVPALLADDLAADPAAKGARKGGRSATYWLLFSKRQDPVVKEQLARAGQHTAQLILLAWTLAGKPKPDAKASGQVQSAS
jgi:hypothetical protein